MEQIVKKHFSITNICLADNNLTVQEAERLATALKSSKSWITQLDVSKNELMDDGVAAIARSLKKNKALKVLNIKDTNCLSEGFKTLAEVLQSNTTLHKVVLSQNSIKSELKEKIKELSDKNKTFKTRVEMPNIQKEASQLKKNLSKHTRTWHSMEEEAHHINQEK